MSFILKWTKQASDHLDDIESYIAADNPTAAQRQVSGIIERAELLTAFPEAGHIYLRTPGAVYREIVYGNYRIFYIIKPAVQRIDIVSVWHGARGKPEL